MTLWGRDILSQIGVLFISANEKGCNHAQMLQMGFLPNNWTGKHHKERLHVIMLEPKLSCDGLGCSSHL